MKYLLIVPDGMGDYALGELGGKTPLAAAYTPYMDKVATAGSCGLFMSVPPGMPPGSAVANMSILGYDPLRYFQGRGVLEAASMGIKLDGKDIAFRCNLIWVEHGAIKSHSAGHITTGEAASLIAMLNRELGGSHIELHSGVSYRHLLVLKGGQYSAEVACTPPHDVLGTSYEAVLPHASSPAGQITADTLNELITASAKLLPGHPVNEERIKQGKQPANMAWPWSPGTKPQMPTFQQRFQLRGAAISAVDLIRGLGVYAGFKSIMVEGATGLYDTNYEGKAAACLAALKEYDFVWVHVEAPDEASHEGNLQLKMQTIEDVDARLIGPVLGGIEKMGLEVTVGLITDHYTPISLKTHVAKPTPFAIHQPGKRGDDVQKFDEKSCSEGSYGLLRGDEFIRALVNPMESKEGKRIP